MATKQEDIQVKYTQLQMLDEQVKMMHKQLQAYEEQQMEIMSVKNAIEDLGKAKPGAEILVPLSPGIFVKGSLIDNRHLNINVGAGIVVEKSLAEGQTLLDKQANDVERARLNVLNETEKIIEQAKKIEKELLQQ